MTDRQDELLRREDWRFFAITKLGTGLGMIATTEVLPSGELANFGLPSAPALFLSLAFASHRKRAGIDAASLFDRHPAPQGTYPDNHTPLFDYFESAIAEVVFSYSAVEAAANESIPETFVYQRLWKAGQAPVSLTREEIERTVPLDEKLKRVLPQALNKVSPAGGRLWPPYLELQDLRDRLIHLKSADRNDSGPEDETIWGRLLRIGPVVFPSVAADLISSFYEPNRRWIKSGLIGA